MVRAAPVRAQTHTSTNPPSINYFCRPPLSWGPAGWRSIVSLPVSIARVVRTQQGVVKLGLGGSHFFKNLEVDLLRIIHFSLY